MRNIVLGLLALSASDVVCAEEATTEHQQETIVSKVTKKGIFNCTSQESRNHIIERNIATFGSVSDLNSGDRYKFEYTETDDYLKGNPVSSDTFFQLTGDIYSASCLSRGYLFPPCTDISVDKFRVFNEEGTLMLRRTYKEDWAGFLIHYFLHDSGQSVFTTPLTCKRTVLAGK